MDEYVLIVGFMTEPDRQTTPIGYLEFGMGAG